MSNSFNVRSEILAAIAKTEDANLKMILLLMLGVLEEIGSKIDTVISDEQSLRDTVLNGHAPKHHAHHDWIEQRMNHQGRCEWANKKIESEREAAETKTGVIRKVLETVLSQVGLVIVTAIGTWAGVSHFMK
jgi:hypothetical protein